MKSKPSYLLFIQTDPRGNYDVGFLSLNQDEQDPFLSRRAGCVLTTWRAARAVEWYGRGQGLQLFDPGHPVSLLPRHNYVLFPHTFV